MREETDDGFGEEDEEDADAAEEKHVVKAGSPDGFFGAVGLLGAEILADKSGGGVAEAPRRQDDEDHDANGDGVTGECSCAENADDAHQADPAVCAMANCRMPVSETRRSRQSTEKFRRIC